MFGKGCLAALLAAVAVCAWTDTARGDDTLRLDLRGGAPQAMTLGLDGDADTLPIHRFGRGFYGGFGRGYYGGFYRPYSYGFYRPYYSGFYRPYYSGFYSPRYYSLGFNYGYSYYRPYYYSSYYVAPPVYYSAPYYCPISLNGSAIPYAPTVTYPNGQGTFTTPYPGTTTPPSQPMPPADNGTFPYNGGPSNPVPIPKADPAPTAVPPRPTVPLDGRAVSLPARPQPQQTKFAYPAYGEQPVKTEFAQDRVVPNRPPVLQAAR